MGAGPPEDYYFTLEGGPSKLPLGRGCSSVAQSGAINNYALGLAARVRSLNANLGFNVFLREAA